jgi:hypothetical protein
MAISMHLVYHWQCIEVALTGTWSSRRNNIRAVWWLLLVCVHGEALHSPRLHTTALTGREACAAITVVRAANGSFYLRGFAFAFLQTLCKRTYLKQCHLYKKLLGGRFPFLSLFTSSHSSNFCSCSNHIGYRFHSHTLMLVSFCDAPRT